MDAKKVGGPTRAPSRPLCRRSAPRVLQRRAGGRDAGRGGDGGGRGPGGAAARPFGGERGWRGAAQLGRGCRRSRDRFWFRPRGPMMHMMLSALEDIDHAVCSAGGARTRFVPRFRMLNGDLILKAVFFWVVV